MPRFNSNLDRVRVAAPCHVDWDTMFGDERVRFCGQCSLNVYNLSEMTRADAELLVSQGEGRLCVRYYMRRDGSIISQNCPVGLRAIKRKVSRVATAIGSAVLSFFTGLGVFALRPINEHRVMGVMALENTSLSDPVSTVIEVQVSPPPEFPMAMGRLALIDEGVKKRRPHRR